MAEAKCEHHLHDHASIAPQCTDFLQLLVIILPEHFVQRLEPSVSDPDAKAYDQPVTLLFSLSIRK